MPRGELWTPCKLYLDWQEDPKDGPREGDFIISTGGSAYLVDEARQSKNDPRRFYLDCIRFDPEQIPTDARVLTLAWYPR